MKKRFPVVVPGKATARVIDAIKHDVRKYVKRERAKELPEGFDTWEFACRVGISEASATPAALNEIGGAIDTAVASSPTEIYVEVLAVPARRATSRVPAATPTTRLE